MAWEREETEFMSVEPVARQSEPLARKPRSSFGFEQGSSRTPAQ